MGDEASDTDEGTWPPPPTTLLIVSPFPVDGDAEDVVAGLPLPPPPPVDKGTLLLVESAWDEAEELLSREDAARSLRWALIARGSIDFKSRSLLFRKELWILMAEAKSR